MEAEGRKAAEAQLEVAVSAVGEQGETSWNWEEEIRRVWDRTDGKIKAKYGAVVSFLSGIGRGCRGMVADHGGRKTEEEPVPEDFRIVMLVPDEVERLSTGEGTSVTWKAVPEGGKWVVRSTL